MDDHRNSSQDFSLEEILADLRTSRDNEPPQEENAPARPAPEPEAERPAPAPAGRRREPEPPPAQEPQPITAEDLAGEEELEDAGPRPGRRARGERRSLGGLFSRWKKEKQEDFSPEDDIYYGLRLKSREEYKKDYEETMSFSTEEQDEESESAYSYLFQQEENEEEQEISDRILRSREERRARVAKVMRQAGLDDGEDIFSLYQKEEAQRANRAGREAREAARVLEKAGGREEEPEEEPAPAPKAQAMPAQPDPQPEPPAPAREEPPTRELDLAELEALKEKSRQEARKKSRSRRRAQPDGRGPEAQPIDLGDGVTRILRPGKQEPPREQEQPSFRPAPPPVFLSEQEEPQTASPAQAAGRERPEEAPAPVKEPQPLAPAPSQEPEPVPRQEPAPQAQPRILSKKSARREHSYRQESGVPLLPVEETEENLEEALTNEVKSYPRPNRFAARQPASAQAAAEPAPPAGAAPQAEPVHSAPPEEEPAAPVFGKRQPPKLEVLPAPAKPESPEPWDLPQEIWSGRDVQTEKGEAQDEAAEPKAEGPALKRHPVKRKPRRRFSIFGGEEADNRPEDEFPADPGEIEDYQKPEDAESILHDFAQKTRSLTLRLAVTGFSLLLMLLFGLISEYSGVLPQAIEYYLLTQPYLILELIFLLIAAAFSWQTLWNGLKGLAKLQANSDSGAAVAVLAAAVHSVFLLFTAGSVEAGQLHIYAPLAVLALFLNTAGKLSMVKRVWKNFRFVAAPDKKSVVRLYDDHNTALRMAKGCVADAPVIAYQTKAGFLKNFLKISYLPDPCEQNSQIIAPIGVVSSLILYIVTLVLTHDAMAALTAFTAACCVCTPMLNQLCVNLPLAQVSRVAARHGAMLSGYGALDRFSDVNAVLLDAKDLFPKNCVVLSGIKTFGGQRIDEAILEAAALLDETGGTLGEIFDQVIQSRRDILPKVENFTYEDGKGLVGWVSGHRILVGTRELMTAHKITPPSRDYEEKYLLGGKKVLYLASGGELVAMFLLAYNAERRRTAELCRLEDNGVAFLVRTCDPNITPELLSQCFQLDPRSVNVLPTGLGKVYQKLTAKPLASASAWMATKGRPTAMMRLLTACIRQRGNISLAVALQNVAVVLGFVLVAFLSCYSGLSRLNTMFLLLYELFWALAILILPRLRKP